MSHPTLFYAPPGEAPRPVNGKRWRDPTTGDVIFNPQPDPARHLLPLEWYVPEPDPRANQNTPVYALNPDGNAVRMSWRTEPKPVAPALQRRLLELRELTRQKGDQTSVGYEREAMELAVALSVANQGGDLWRTDGTWVSLNPAQVTALVSSYATAIKDVMATARMHSEALRAMAAANDIIGLMEYDITTGWPA